MRRAVGSPNSSRYCPAWIEDNGDRGGNARRRRLRLIIAAREAKTKIQPLSQNHMLQDSILNNNSGN